MPWLTSLQEERNKFAERQADPWRRKIERDLPANVTNISTVGLLDLLDLPASTGNARILARTMRSMGWVSLKSRRLMPGGFRDTTIRGWARPVQLLPGCQIRQQ